MLVQVEYHGKWLEWCICTTDGEVMLDSFASEWSACHWAVKSGWEVV